MAGRPTVTVLLEDATGAFIYDVSAYTHLPAGITIRRGRGDETDKVQPSDLKLRLDNVDGRFTLGSATYGIRIDQRIRVKLNGVTRYTGKVQDWPTTWPSPTASYAEVQITAVDRLTPLSRRKLRTIIENEILVDAPEAYYPLGEAAGSLTAGDASGHGGPTLVQAGFGAPVAFGAVGPIGGEELTAASFTGADKYLASTAPALGVGTLTVEAVVLRNGNVPGIPNPGAPRPFWESASSSDTADVLGVGITTGGLVQVWIHTGSTIAPYMTSTSVVTDNAFHHVAVVIRPGGTSELYVDGVLEVSYSGAGLDSWSSTGSGPVLGGYYQAGGHVGTLAHVAWYTTALTAARIASHATAALTGAAGDRSDQRLARLASYAGIPAGDLALEVGTLTSMPALPMAGTSVADGIEAIESAEGGAVFFAGDERLVMHNRQHRTLEAAGAAALALSAADVNHDDLVISADKQYLLNYLTGSREGGATQIVADQASIDQYDQYPEDLSLAVTTDDEVLDALTWRVAAYAQPKPRLSTMTLDLLTLSSAQQAAALALELGDRLTVASLPSQSPIATADLIAEGWTETVTEADWSMTFNTSPASVVQAWVLGDATLGVLDSTTRLYY